MARFACPMPHPDSKIDGFVEFAILGVLPVQKLQLMPN
jgi:hypothetical protein